MSRFPAPTRWLVACVLVAGCAHPPPPHPAKCVDCVDPTEVVRLAPAQLQARLGELARQWQQAAGDDPSDDACDRFARSYAVLADPGGRSVAVGRFNAAVVRAECDQPQRAAALYRTVIDDPKASDALRASALNNLGIGEIEAGRPELGRRALERAIEIDPRSPAPRTNLAALLQRESGESDEAFAAAERQLQNALALRSDDRPAFENLAQLYYVHGRDHDTAYLMLADLVVTQGLAVLERNEERSAALLNVRGLILLERDDPHRALRAFDAAIEVEPTHAQAHLNRAMIALRLRDFSTARDSLKVAAADPQYTDQADVLLAIGVAYRGLRQFDEARRAFERAHATAGDPRGLYNLGLLFHEHIAPNATDYDPDQYKLAQKYYRQFTAAAAASGRQDLRLAVSDAKRRDHQITELFDAIRINLELEAEAERLESLERKQRAEDKARLLELERRAKERSDGGAGEAPA